jgi:hypothetical protein
MFEKPSIKSIIVFLFFTLALIPLCSSADSAPLTVATTPSQPNPAYSALEPDLDLLGRWYGGPVYSSVVSGDYVYFGTGGGFVFLK